MALRSKGIKINKYTILCQTHDTGNSIFLFTIWIETIGCTDTASSLSSCPLGDLFLRPIQDGKNNMTLINLANLGV